MDASRGWFCWPPGVLLLPIMMAAASALMLSEARAARDVAAKRECATCHVMWLKEFKRDDVTPLIPFEPKPVEETGRQDVASTERMCFSCHDGFMLDSRFLWARGHDNHPVGVEPSKMIKIPTSGGKIIFPLNDDGKMYCGTCHTAHGVDWAQEESPVFMRVKNVDSSICLACHLDHGTGLKEGNHPVFRKPGKTPGRLIEAGAKLGKDGDVICQTCHRSHGARGDNLLVLQNRSAGVCRGCHADKAPVRGTKHDLSIMVPAARNSKGHRADRAGPCSACHMLHGAKGPALLGRNIARGPDAVSSVCSSCHRRHGLAKEKTIGGHSHPNYVRFDALGVSVAPDEWISPSLGVGGSADLVPLPLFDIRGERVQVGGRVNCATCHDAHVWNADHPDRKGDPRKTEGNGRNSFLRIAQGLGSSLCTNCHLDKRAVLASSHDPKAHHSDIAAKMRKADGQRSLDQGICGTCHRAHNGEGAYMLARKGPADAGVIQGVCLDCHRKGHAGEKRLIGDYTHPLGMSLTGIGADSDLPVYAADGRVDEKDGKLDCATCHDVHQWDPVNPRARLKGSDTEGGDGRNSFLRRPAAPASELCVDCHQDEGLVRGTDHDLAVTAPHAVNHNGQGVEQSGTCGQCHSVHGALSPRNLWARAPGKGPTTSEAWCRGCHSPGGVAEEKVPPVIDHPVDIIVWASTGRVDSTHKDRGGMPVYDGRGEQVAGGLITCPSCHNPHQWNPRKRAAGSGRNIEGDALSSFLRNASSENIVCADCHGKDALFRYKYFHGKASRGEHPLYR